MRIKLDLTLDEALMVVGLFRNTSAQLHVNATQLCTTNPRGAQALEAAAKQYGDFAERVRNEIHDAYGTKEIP